MKHTNSSKRVKNTKSTFSNSRANTSSPHQSTTRPSLLTISSSHYTTTPHRSITLSQKPSVSSHSRAIASHRSRVHQSTTLQQRKTFSSSVNTNPSAPGFDSGFKKAPPPSSPADSESSSADEGVEPAAAAYATKPPQNSDGPPSPGYQIGSIIKPPTEEELSFVKTLTPEQFSGVHLLLTQNLKLRANLRAAEDIIKTQFNHLEVIGENVEAYRDFIRRTYEIEPAVLNSPQKLRELTDPASIKIKPLEKTVDVSATTTTGTTKVTSSGDAPSPSSSSPSPSLNDDPLLKTPKVIVEDDQPITPPPSSQAVLPEPSSKVVTPEMSSAINQLLEVVDEAQRMRQEYVDQVYRRNIFIGLLGVLMTGQLIYSVYTKSSEQAIVHDLTHQATVLHGYVDECVSLIRGFKDHLPQLSSPSPSSSPATHPADGALPDSLPATAAKIPSPPTHGGFHNPKLLELSQKSTILLDKIRIFKSSFKGKE